jgi:hypothetical protein
MRRIMKDAAKGISHKWQILLAFFLGGAVSSIAQDPSDALFFMAAKGGELSPFQQTWYWYWVPFLLYLGFFLIGFILARTRLCSPVFVVYLFIALIFLSTVVSLTLPQRTLAIYTASVLLGTAVSVGIMLGLKGRVD